jgi:hypothetical protein
MRRCGRASCVVAVGVLTAAIVAGGAFAEAGGNGKKGGQGKGHAWAKGHVKHAAATPQLASPPEPESQVAPTKHASPPAARHHEAAPPGAATRHQHLTICHATGSGYVVISPNVNGALNGHLKHHDDFVYVNGCTRPAGDPGGDPPRDPPPSPTHPPRDPPSPTTSVPPRASPSGDLPFTGLPAYFLLLAGLALVGGGLALRWQTRSLLAEDDEGVDLG